MTEGSVVGLLVGCRSAVAISVAVGSGEKEGVGLRVVGEATGVTGWSTGSFKWAAAATLAARAARSASRFSAGITSIVWSKLAWWATNSLL